MDFTPKTKKELDESQLIPKGYYPLDCYEAEEKDSKKGNPMMVLKLKVYVGNGTSFYTDYIVTGNDMGLAKLYGFCEATGQLDKYNEGTLTAEDAKGRSCYGYFVQKTDRQTDELRNELRAYMTEAEAMLRHEKATAKQGGASSIKAVASKLPASAQPDEGDDVPF